jgi:hypothetical protein
VQPLHERIKLMDVYEQTMQFEPSELLKQLVGLRIRPRARTRGQEAKLPVGEICMDKGVAKVKCGEDIPTTLLTFYKTYDSEASRVTDVRVEVERDGEWIPFEAARLSDLRGEAVVKPPQVSIADAFAEMNKWDPRKPLYRSCRIGEVDEEKKTDIVAADSKTAASSLSCVEYFSRMGTHIKNGNVKTPFLSLSSSLEVAAWWSFLGIAPIVRVDCKQLPAGARLWDCSDQSNRHSLFPEHSQATPQRAYSGRSQEVIVDCAIPFKAVRVLHPTIQTVAKFELPDQKAMPETLDAKDIRVVKKFEDGVTHPLLVQVQLRIAAHCALLSGLFTRKCRFRSATSDLF